MKIGCDEVARLHQTQCVKAVMSGTTAKYKIEMNTAYR